MEELDRKVYGGNDEPMTLGNWIITYLLMMIPIANIVLAFVWAFGSNVNTSKKNFFRAYLIFAAIGIVLSILFASYFISAFMAAMHSPSFR